MDWIMNVDMKAADFGNAQESAFSLLRNIAACYSASPVIPFPHAGAAFEELALRHAEAANALEVRFAAQVYKVAKNIAGLSGEGWEKDKNILALWSVVAQAVTMFSEHPSKNIAALIIDGAGNLHAFGANRIPDGAAKLGCYYVEGRRKDYIVCAERIAVARHLDLKVQLPDPAVPDYENLLKLGISALTDDIRAAAKNGPSLENSFLLTTSVPCALCADAIAPHKPKGIITVAEADNRIKRTRENAPILDFLKNQGIPFICLKQPALV